jgi:hypothetical protein
MKLHQDIEPFRAAIQATQRLLVKFNNRGVIIGGIAVGFLGKPRFTEDVDAMFLLSIQDIPEFLEAARHEDIQPRSPDAAEFARKSRVLLLKHVPTEINIDISLGILPFEEEMVARGVVQSAGTLSIRLPTPEDLIIMKAIARKTWKIFVPSLIKIPHWMWIASSNWFDPLARFSKPKLCGRILQNYSNSTFYLISTVTDNYLQPRSRTPKSPHRPRREDFGLRQPVIHL